MLSHELYILSNDIYKKNEDLIYINHNKIKSLIDGFNINYKNMFKLSKFGSNLNKKNYIIRSIFVNMFNYNFWPECNDVNITPPSRTFEMFNWFDEIFNDDNSYRYYLLQDNLDRLGETLHKYNFKMSHDFYETIKKLKETFNSYDNFKQFEDFVDNIYNLTSEEIVSELKKLFPYIYGKDIFCKREIMIIFLIKHKFGKGFFTKCDNSLFPIDYRIPGVLIQYDILSFDFDTTQLFQKNDLYEKIIRASAFKILYEISNEFDINNHEFDEYMFLTSRNKNLMHLKCNTTDY